MKKIVVAGAGHGGLTAAAYLAEQGYQVDVYEQKAEGTLGYDWDDQIGAQTFEHAGIEYDKKDVFVRERSAFYSTSMQTPILIDFPPEARLFEIQRKTLYNYLIDNAVKKGVRIHYGIRAERVSLDSMDRVSGIIAGGEEISADLVIDSAGMFSPLRQSLPAAYGIPKELGANSIFYTYRACYDLVPGKPITNPGYFNVYFKFAGIDGIGWFKIVDGLADVIIGSVKPITMDESLKLVEELRKAQPSIGYELKRGGYMTTIPIRPCFPIFVGDNYALVGDSAAMTVPVNGSGMTNSIIAGKLLAETVSNIGLAGGKAYTKELLWDYEVKYMKEVGAGMASIDPIKHCLLGFSSKAIDFLFDKGILSGAELAAGMAGNEINLGIRGMLDKARRGYKKLFVLLRLSGALNDSKKAKQNALKIPCVYNEAACRIWADKYQAFLK